MGKRAWEFDDTKTSAASPDFKCLAVLAWNRSALVGIGDMFRRRSRGANPCRHGRHDHTYAADSFVRSRLTLSPLPSFSVPSRKVCHMFYVCGDKNVLFPAELPS